MIIKKINSFRVLIIIDFCNVTFGSNYHMGIA